MTEVGQIHSPKQPQASQADKNTYFHTLQFNREAKVRTLPNPARKTFRREKNQCCNAIQSAIAPYNAHPHRKTAFASPSQPQTPLRSLKSLHFLLF